MPPLPRAIGVALDLAGCPNRCRHCYLGNRPNGRLSTDVLRQVAGAFRQWRRSGEDKPYFTQVDVSSWYREPDYSDDYAALHDLERELSRRAPRRYELLSIWRLARDADYAPWAATLGPKVCQVTFFGGEKVTDWFCRRRGAWNDNLTATERLLAVGMIPRWQIILTRKGLPDLAAISAVADEMCLEKRAALLGGRFDVFCNLPGPDGEAFDIEDMRLEESDLAYIPAKLMESTRTHFGDVNWRTEADIVAGVIAGGVIAPFVPDTTWFLVNADIDVFSNYGDLTRGWRLGNFGRDPLSGILDKFEGARTPALHAAFDVPTLELARRFGRRDSRFLYASGDLKARWVRMYADAEVAASKAKTGKRT